MQAFGCEQMVYRPGRGVVVSDEPATGNGLNAFNRPKGTEVILGVGAPHQAKRRLGPVGLPPQPIEFSAPVQVTGEMVAALKRVPPHGLASRLLRKMRRRCGLDSVQGPFDPWNGDV